MKKRIFLLLTVILCLSMCFIPANAASGNNAIDITSGWYWPLSQSNPKISSGFGATRSNSLHQGDDIPAPKGTPIYAARSGVVYLAGKQSSMGYYVCIRHGTSNRKYIFTTYMHMTKYTVKAGQSVDQNTIIGYVGSTGNSTGNHLHFHIFKSDKASPGTASPAHKNKTDLNNNYIDPSSVQYSYSQNTASAKTNTANASTLEVKMTSYPDGNHKQGANHGVRGDISSNYNITSVSGSVIDSSGRTVLSSLDKPNAKSMIVKNSNLNNKITFNTLTSGSYTFKVTATDASSKTVSWSHDFRVIGSNLKINMTKWPSSLKYGKFFGLRGEITSDEKITSVKGSVFNSSGKTVLSSSDKPNSKSMNVKNANLNNKLEFNKLTKGNYTLKIVATDASGNTTTWSNSFRVY